MCFYLKVCLFYADFAEGFNHKGCWILSNAFSASIEMIMWCLFLILFMWCITFTDLQMLDHPGIPGMKPIWSWSWNHLISIFSVCYWSRLARIFWRSLHLCHSGILICGFLCLLCPFLVLVLGWYWLAEWFRKYSLSFGTVSIGLVPILLCVIEFSCESVWSWTFFGW